MLRRCVYTFILLCLALLFPAGTMAATRVALIVGSGPPVGRTVLDLATAKASNLPGVELLERAGIDRVLAEQKLTAAGLTDAGKAIQVGKLLSADVLAIIEVSSDDKGALALIVFDAKTGLRLWDAVLPEGAPDKAASGVAQGVQAALKKRDAGHDGLRMVGFMAVRNADLPRSMDSFCDSLAALVERRLIAAPAVGVLERERLEAVTKERALGAAEKELLGSLVQLDLEVRRDAENEGLLATIQLTDSTGKKVGKVTIPVKSSDSAAAADGLAQKICEAVKVEAATGKGDPGREAKRFLDEANQMASLQQHPQALRAAECAYALDPNNSSSGILLAFLLAKKAGSELAPKPLAQHKLAIKPEAVQTAVVLVRRIVDIRSRVLTNLPAKNAVTLRALRIESNTLRYAIDNVLGTLDAIDPVALTPDTRLRLAELTELIEQWENQYLDVLATATEREPALFDMYAQSLVDSAARHRWVAPDAAHSTRKVNGLVERWLKVVNKMPLGPRESGILAPGWILTWYASENVDPRWIPGERDLEKVDGLFTIMEKHTHPIIRFQGRCGHIWVALKNKKTTPEKAYKLYLDIRNDTLKTLRNSAEPAPREMVITYYEFLTTLYTFNSLDFTAAKTEWVERYDAWESMLDSNIIIAVVLFRPTQDGVGPDFAPRKLALINRTLAMIDDSSVPVAGGYRKNLKDSLLRIRSKLLEKQGQQTHKPEVPWERVQTLVDIRDLQGIAELHLPTIAGTDVYAVALSHASNRIIRGDKQTMQILRVPLSGEEPQLLGQTPISLRITFGPLAGCQVGPREVYVATTDQGLYAFPRDGGAPRRIDNKDFPSEGFESLALYDGRLYAALVGGYLVSIDPATGKFDVLASSRRREKASPFDDANVFHVPFLAADTKRQRIVFILHQGRTDPALPNGLWSWDPAKKEFKRLLETGGSEWALLGNPITGDHFLLASGRMAVDFDLANDKFQVIWAVTNPGVPASNGPLLLNKDALCQESFQVNGAKMYRNGMLWSTAPFARMSMGVTEFSGCAVGFGSPKRKRGANIGGSGSPRLRFGLPNPTAHPENSVTPMSIADKKQDVFPAPQRQDSARPGDYSTLLSAGENDLLVASPSAIWLITLRNK